MANALQINGAQSEKATKATPLYVGRIFSGIWTNRSPLRDAITDRITEKFYGPAGDAMIAGSNVEVTNRLTLSRRPGNPKYDATNEYTDVLTFDEFRYSKALSDIWGTTIEQIDTMVDTAASLYSNNSGISTDVWDKTGAGQSFMQEVGSQLYFGNGIDQKKWNQSLFVRNTGNNSSVIPTNSYPFMDTFTVVPIPATSPIQYQIQQLIGVQIAQIDGAALSANVLTLTLDAALGDGYDVDHVGGKQAIGTMFMIWGMTGDAAVLNGAMVTLLDEYTSADATHLVASFIGADFSVTGQTGILQVGNGVTSGVANTLGDVVITSTVTTGGSVPTWGTTPPSSSNNFQGDITVDGNSIWVNRGTTVQNWGIAAPTIAPIYSAKGSQVGWEQNTYYSLGSIYEDSNHYLWQVSGAGLSGATNPFPVSTPTKQKKASIKSVYISSGIVYFKTGTQAFTAGEIITLQYLVGASFLNGLQVTVSSTALSTTAFQANVPAGYTGGNYSSASSAYPSIGPAPDDGVAILGGNTFASPTSPNPTTTVIDNTVVWTCIEAPSDLTWAANKQYFQGDIVKGVPAAGQISYFLLNRGALNNYPTPQPTLVAGSLSAYTWPNELYGKFDRYYPAIGTQTSIQSPTSLHWRTAGYPSNESGVMESDTVNGAGTASTTGPSMSQNAGEWAIIAQLYIPAAGSYSFTLTNDDGAFFSFDDVNTKAYLANGSFTEATSTHPLPSPHTTTAIRGYGSGPGQSGSGQNLCGQNNQIGGGKPYVNTGTWFFPSPGVYEVEIDYCNYHGNSDQGSIGEMLFVCNKQEIAITPDQSGPTAAPAWPTFTTSGATYNSVQEEIIFGTADIVQESADQYTWVNIGPVTSFPWVKDTNYTLPGTNVIDSTGNEEGAIETGITSAAPPKWNTGGLNSITLDNGTLAWINEGAIPPQPGTLGKITATSAQGWIYGISLVNTLDNTVSNIGPLSAPTGPLVNGNVTFAPGAGLIESAIDPQADYVAIFRTADGFTTELLIAGYGNSIYTVPLSQYLTNGYVDQTPDTGLDTQASAPQADQNTPPLPGAINLAYHLNRIFFSVGNTVFWTSGPDDPIGNGINGFGPNNYDKMTALVKRLVPTSIGLLVFTVSDVFIIPDNGSGAVLPSKPWIPGVGISSYNALDMDGPSIGFFTTDSQFLMLSPGGGVIESIPIADQLNMRNGTPGQKWYPEKVFVTHHASGSDMGWFLSDGEYGWFRLVNNPAPEKGSMSWSPFATIQGGVKAVKSVETAPGVHRLLLGPTGSGYILNRDLTATTDGGATGSNGTAYPAYAVFGSYVLAQPGQVAQVSFVTLKSVRTGSPAVLGLLLDDALPYYKGSFEILKDWVNDPPELKPSRSWYAQRFYLSDMPDTAAACTDMQVMIQWPPEAALNELQSFTIFGSFVQER